MKNTENKMKWSAFIESTIVNFFTENGLEKMTIEDGNGNKAKLSKQKDNSIKVEYTSISVL